MKYKRVYSKRDEKWKWAVDGTIAGQRIRRADFETKREAQEAMAALRAQARAARYGLVLPGPAITLQQLVKARTADPKIIAQRGADRILQGLLEIIPGGTPVLKLTKADLKKYLSSFEGLSSSTINRYHSTVISMLYAAGEYFTELEDYNPPRIKRLKEGPGRQRVLLAEEVGQLLAGLKMERQRLERYKTAKVKHTVYDLLRLMLLTGAREGELLRLDQTAINWNWRTVRIDATKTQTVRIIPLGDLAAEILQKRGSNGRFFNLTYHQLWGTLKRLSVQTGIVAHQDAPGGWVFYDLRHTAASVMELHGVSYSTVAAILGHKRGDMTAKYTHSTLESMRQGVKVLEDWCRQIDGFCLDFGEKQSIQENQAILAG